jgi:hypothetical protein
MKMIDISQGTSIRQSEQRTEDIATAVWNYTGPFDDPFAAVDLLSNPFPLPRREVLMAAGNNEVYVCWWEHAG